MKNLVVVLVMLVSFLTMSLVSVGQTSSKDIAKGKVVKWSVVKKVSPEGERTFFYWGFQNQKYSHIIDRGSVFYSTKVGLVEFIVQLEECCKQENGVDFSYGNCTLYDFSNKIYIHDDRKYTTITKKTAMKLVIELKQIVDLLSV